jgi:2,3-bisphosphoglycerate-independent phosphoglycerate mutase
MVAALGADPPDRSTHFRLSLLSTDGELVRAPQFLPTEEELRSILAAAQRLQTPRLKLVEGPELEHGPVWEDGSIELRCATPQEAATVDLARALPVGDGESMLRRFIDDSINLLSELELNRIRQEEDLGTLNLLWPWSPGFRPRLPNLTVARGVSVRVESPDFALAGLARLVGYRTGNPWTLGTGTRVKLESMSAALRAVPVGLAALPTLGELRIEGKREESAWLGREVLTRLVEPLLDEAEAMPLRIVLMATSESLSGLVLDYVSNGPVTDLKLPFLAEVAEERGIPSTGLRELIEEATTAA